MESHTHFSWYLAAVLDRQAREQLLGRIELVHPVLFLHHMTIAYKPNPKTIGKYASMIGTEQMLAVTGIAYNKYVQALIVDSHLSENPRPHITVSCAQDVQPVESNSMLESENMYRPVNIVVRTTIEMVIHDSVNNHFHPTGIVGIK